MSDNTAQNIYSVSQEKNAASNLVDAVKQSTDIVEDITPAFQYPYLTEALGDVSDKTKEYLDYLAALKLPVIFA